VDTVRQKRLTPALLLFAALLLRAVIPAGYMPAAAGSGLWFELCPEGVPAEFAEFLSVDIGHHHHGNADGENTGEDDHQCPVGHMLLSAAAADSTSQSADLAPDLPPATISIYSFTSTTRTHYYSRGPPA
jgi:hypothetical protein